MHYRVEHFLRLCGGLLAMRLFLTVMVLVTVLAVAHAYVIDGTGGGDVVGKPGVNGLTPAPTGTPTPTNTPTPTATPTPTP